MIDDKCYRWRHVRERNSESLHINKGDMPQTVGSFRQNVFGTDLISIETEHLQPGEV